MWRSRHDEAVPAVPGAVRLSLDSECGYGQIQLELVLFTNIETL